MMGKQMIYTSCKRGIGKEGSGFQIYSYTEGISEEIRSKLVKLGAYSLGSTGLKTVSDDYSNYPLAFRFWGGKDCKAMIRSRYLGLDWSGTRAGSNYLAHSIIFDNTGEADNNIYPVSFIGSESFEKTIELEQFKLDEEPKVLDAITPTNTDLRFEDVCTFIKEQPHGVEIVKTTISKLLHGESITIYDRQENMKMWIAACTMILPKKVAWNISFTTYDLATGHDSQFSTIAGPSIIGAWISDDECRKTVPSKLEWNFDPDYNDLFEEYINIVFDDPSVRNNYLDYVNNLKEVDTIEKAILSLIVYRGVSNINYSKKLLDIYDRNMGCCFNDKSLHDLGSLLLNEAYSSDSLDCTNRLLDSIDDVNLVISLKKKRYDMIVKKCEEVKSTNNLADEIKREIQRMLSFDCKDDDPLVNEQLPIMFVAIIVSIAADYTFEKEWKGKNPCWNLRYNSNKILGLTEQYNSEGEGEKLLDCIENEGKVGFILRDMPLDPKLKLNLAHRYFKDIKNHVEIKNMILETPKHFEIQKPKDCKYKIIEAFYKTEETLKELKDEKNVFRFEMSTIGTDIGLLKAYKNIIEDLQKTKPTEIKPLIDTVARRIREKENEGSKNTEQHLDQLDQGTRTAYYKLKLIDKECIKQDDVKSLIEYLGVGRKEYVLDIIEKSRERGKECDKEKENVEWLKQLLTIYGGPSAEFGDALIGNLSEQKNTCNDSIEDTSHKKGSKKKEKNRKDSELKMKCLYITALLEQNNTCPDSSDLATQPPLFNSEIKRHKVDPRDLDKYLKKGSFECMDNLLKKYENIIHDDTYPNEKKSEKKTLFKLFKKN